MRSRLTLWLVAALIATACAYAACAYATSGALTAKAGKFTVRLSTPSPLKVGDNTLSLKVTNGSKPLNGAGVTVTYDMTDMPMPGSATVKPGKTPGVYLARANFAMEGTWVLKVRVKQMTDMDMAGDGVATFNVQVK